MHHNFLYKDSFWRVVAQCTALLPEDKPRYVMGLLLKLKHKSMAEDTHPIDPTCACMVFESWNTHCLELLVCKNYTRAYIHCLVTKDAMGSQLLSYHNLHCMLPLQTKIIAFFFMSFVISCN
ncbi:hypothetical protein POTOM_060381 [Populus tomentosa]|uniref:tRNA-guanine(15) transglycosylase-like domain-containing protein n=1 Tax=Populus tomentosa TaxID=118781 RepID=A0A8X8C0F7_POPTO|nr:hypothetical protein POTOM_060381 [Populus tomentosa]